MTRRSAYHALALATFVLILAIVPAKAGTCSSASQAGKWAYTYTGTLFSPNGPLPVASVGRFSQDAAGNIQGSQARSVAGQSGVEDISGALHINHDCTATGTINVEVGGQLLRTAELALVYDMDGNHMRAIFVSLVAADGTNIPVVITIDGNRLKPRDD